MARQKTPRRSETGMPSPSGFAKAPAQRPCRRWRQEPRQPACLFAEPAKKRRSEAAAGERKKHARGEIEIAQRTGKRRRQYHEIHDVAGGWNPGAFEDAHEGTLPKTDFRPGDYADHQRQSSEVKKCP